MAANAPKDIDKGWRRHGKSLQELSHGDPHILVGILGPEAKRAHVGTQLTTIEVGSYHEFGRGNNPERSFIRGNFDANEKKYRQMIRKLADMVLTNKLDPKTALGQLGEKIVSDTRSFMAAGIPPEKADGSTARLKATGQLYGSIVWELRGL